MLRVLLVNDDGVYAEGLHALRRALEALPGTDVYVAAPERERSASSHAITLHKPLHVNNLQLEGTNGPTWAISGTPADCTKLGVLSLLPDKPDLVVSGINRGANVGVDVLYSGTVSAALEGVVLGIPSLAISLAGWRDFDYGPAAAFSVRLIQRLTTHPPAAEPFLLNVNIPPCEPTEATPGVVVTRLGMRYYNDVVHPREDPRGRAYYWLAGEVRDVVDEADTDVSALANHLISITPLKLNLTDEVLRTRLGAWAERL